MHKTASMRNKKKIALKNEQITKIIKDCYQDCMSINMKI